MLHSLFKSNIPNRTKLCLWNILVWIYCFAEQANTNRDVLKYPRLLDGWFRFRKRGERFLPYWLEKSRQASSTSLLSLAFIMKGNEESLHTSCHICVSAVLQGGSVTCLLKSHSHFSSAFLNHKFWKTVKAFALCWVAFKNISTGDVSILILFWRLHFLVLHSSVMNTSKGKNGIIILIPPGFQGNGSRFLVTLDSFLIDGI